MAQFIISLQVIFLGGTMNHWTTKFKLLAVLAITGGALAQELDSGTEAYINQFFNTLQTWYLNNKKVDLLALKTEVFDTARKAPKDQALQAVSQSLKTLNDPAVYVLHWTTAAEDARRREVGEIGLRSTADTRVIFEVYEGDATQKAGIRVGDELVSINGAAPVIENIFVFTKSNPVPVVVKRGEQTLTFNITLAPAKQPFKAPLHAGRLGKAAYIEPDRSYTPSVSERSHFATEMQSQLRQLDASGACGYVIDLRRSVWNLSTLIAGLGPLLGTGDQPVLKYQYPDGKFDELTFDSKRNVASWAFETVASALLTPWKMKKSNVSVAVLTSPFNDEDSGPLLFRGRQNTRFFGEARAFPPYGYRGERLPDYATLTFPDSRAVDRTGHIYNAPLEPDETVITDWAKFGGKQDTVIQSALEWLNSQPGCR
jgi:carboxyl-terminal processing protease